MDRPTPLVSRERRLEALFAERFDVLVVGGGATGAATALDLALRGARVALVERGDWGQETSSASSRLLHGGLRYLEQFEFGLVRESCLERALLLRNAAGLAWPERFTFPLFRGDRVGRAKLAAGLALYTALSVPRVLGLPRIVGADAVRAGIPGIADGLVGGGTYLDGATLDGRLVWAVVRTAIEKGAVCTSRVEVQRIEHEGGDGVEAALRDVLSGTDLGTLRARHVVLCGGPFTEELRARAGLSGKWLAPTRGTHVVLPRRRLPTDGAVVLPSRVDGRVMFVLPWPAHTIVGTTDVDAAVERRSDDGRGASSEKEIDYLLASANALVPAARLTRADVVSTWSGLRPLLAADAANPSARSREERVEHAGCVTTIAGGKLTAFRGMAEGVAVAVARRLVHTSGGRAIDGRSESATRELRLWGALAAPVPPPAWTHREPDAEGLRAAALVARYGRFVRARREYDEGLGADAVGPELDAATRWSDVAWAAAQEDALLPADVLLRRTDLGYTRGPAAASLEGEIAERLARHRAR